MLKLTAILVGLPVLFPIWAWGAPGGNTASQPAAAVPDAPIAQVPQGFSQDTPIETLAANPDAAAIVDKYMPSLLQNPRYPLFKSMSLKTVAAMSCGRISAETLSEVDAQLKAMPVAA